MRCPFCDSTHSAVLESRIVEDGESLRRRRQCEKCEKRFTTYERIRLRLLLVVKKDGRREPFNREKLREGVLRAIHKRPVSIDMVEEVVRSIEGELLTKEKDEVSSKSIGREVLKRLKKIDKVAWLRFASVYLEFEDLQDFERAMGDNKYA